MNKYLDYIKSHPYLSGVIGLVCVVVFVMIVRGGSSAKNTAQYVDSGPSDSEIAAGSATQIAMINSQAEVQTANFGYQTALRAEELNAQVSFAEIAAQEKLGLATLLAQENTVKYSVDGANARQSGIMAALASLKPKARARAFQAFVTGQPVIKSSNPGNSVGGILNGVANVAKEAGPLL